MNAPMLYSYRLVASDGSVSEGVLEALSRDEVVEALRSRGLPASVAPTRRPLAGVGRAGGDLAEVLTSLAHLLDAGLPLARALDVLQEGLGRAWAGAMPGVRLRVERGEPLSQALRSSSISVPDYLLGLIEAGEAGSRLAPAVSRAAELAESQRRLRAALWEALTYPLILLIAGGASVALLAGVVLPAFAELLEGAGRDLPRTTAVVLGVSQFFSVSWPLLGALGLLSGALSWLFVRGPEGRTRWHRLLLAAPGIGGLRRSLATGRFATTLAALVESGVPLPRALSLAGNACGDAVMRAAARAASDRVSAGSTAAQALAASDVFTKSMVRLVGIGEEAGGLHLLVARAGALETERGLRSLNRGMRAVEPALILVFGAVVAIVAASLLQAMYAFGVSP